MSYLLLAVVFYTVVRFSVEAWSQLRYEKNDEERDYGFAHDIQELGMEVTGLEVRVGTLEEKEEGVV